MCLYLGPLGPGPEWPSSFNYDGSELLFLTPNTNMATLTRPNIELRLAPKSTSFSRSNGSSYADWGLRAMYYVKETSTGVRRRKPRGWLNPQPYVFERQEISSPAGSNRYMPSGYPTTNGQWFQGVCYTVPGDAVTRESAMTIFNRAYHELSWKGDDGLRNAALIAARNRLKSSSIDLGLAFAERKQTERLVVDNLRRVTKSFEALKRGQTRRAMNELGLSRKKREPRGASIPQKWLELQYGVKPLASDIYGACDSLATRDKSDWRVTATATRKLQFNVSTSMIGGTDYWNAGTVQASVWKSVFTRIDALPENEMLISLSSLGLLNPLSVAWEKTYLSFVVDWAYPLGDFFDSLDSMLGYSTGAYSSSLLVKADWSFKGNPSWNGPSGRKTENKTAGRMRRVYLDRQVSASVPLPRLPSFKDPRSLGHVANALALLAGAFGRNSRKYSRRGDFD